jgi:hypothetical protein
MRITLDCCSMATIDFLTQIGAILGGIAMAASGLAIQVCLFHRCFYRSSCGLILTRTSQCVFGPTGVDQWRVASAPSLVWPVWSRAIWSWSTADGTGISNSAVFGRSQYWVVCDSICTRGICQHHYGGEYWLGSVSNFHPHGVRPRVSRDCVRASSRCDIGGIDSGLYMPGRLFSR